MILRKANNRLNRNKSHLTNAVYVQKLCHNCARGGSVLKRQIVRHWLDNQPHIRLIFALRRRIRGSSSASVSITSASNRLWRNKGWPEIPRKKTISLHFFLSRKSNQIIRKCRLDTTTKLPSHRRIMALETQVQIYSRLWRHLWMCQDPNLHLPTLTTLSQTWRSPVTTLVPTITLWSRQLTISGFRW